jgi:putative transcriptional regulator
MIGLAICAHGAEIRMGELLVATEKSHDPDFAGSVVVLVRYDSEAAVGLMLNKPTDVPISDILPEAKGRGAIVYAGGPIAIGIRGLVRTKTAPFFSIVMNKPRLLKLLSTDPSSVRIYAGYVGWTARQLESEVERGLWRVRPPDAKAIFNDGR